MPSYCEGGRRIGEAQAMEKDSPSFYDPERAVLAPRAIAGQRSRRAQQSDHVPHARLTNTCADFTKPMNFTT